MSQFQNVSKAFGKGVLINLILVDLLNVFGASIREFSIVMLLVYQIPDLAVSVSTEFVTLILLLYQRGYFHLNEQLSIIMLLLSFNGDSPSEKVE